jgi:hypothetical protein
MNPNDPYTTLTIRDKIAVEALKGLYANPAFELAKAEMVARWSYEAADALIAHSNKKQ